MTATPKTRVGESPTSAATHFADRARELAEFCLRHGKHPFGEWNVRTLYTYVFFHVVTRTVLSTREHGAITAVAFVWGMPEREIRSRAARREPLFAWQRSVDTADALFMAEVVGSKEQLPRLMRQALVRWPDFGKKRIFTFRDGSLHELKHETLERMLNGR